MEEHPIGNTRSEGRPADWLALGGVLLVAAWARLSSLPKVLIGGELMPQGGDSAYHLRRTMVTAQETFPRVLSHDPWMNWPDGGPCHWAPGMDFLGALLVRGTGLDPAGTPAAVLVSCLPVAVGLAVVGATVACTRQLIPHGRRSWLPYGAGLLVAVLPQSVATSRFGRVDHHVFEVLCMALLGLWVLQATRERRGGRWELTGCLILFLGLSTFSGSVLYAGLAMALLLLLTLPWMPPAPEDEATGARSPGLVGSGAPAFLGAALLSLPLYAAPDGEPFSYVFPSLLQPLLLVLAACALTLFRSTPQLKRLLTLAWAAATVALFALFCVKPQLVTDHPAALGLVEWVGRQDPWLASIDEFQPLFAGGLFTELDGGRVDRYFGLIGLLSPLLIPLGLWSVFRKDLRLGAVFTLWTVALVGLCLWQSRFGRLATVNLAICSALALGEAARRLPLRRLHQQLCAAAALVLLILLSPPLRSSLVLSAPRSLAPVEEAGLFLRTNEAEELREGSDRGVSIPWDMGHFILWIAERPVVATGFGTYLDRDGFQEVQTSQLGSEDQLVRWMERRQLGYLVAGAATFLGRITAFDGTPALVPDDSGLGVLNPTFLQDLPVGATLVGGSGLPAAEVRHLSRLRPVFASSATVSRTALPIPSLWVYQRVEPQLLSGEGVPGEAVFARIDLDVRGTPWPWAAATTVGEDGQWSIPVPLELGSQSGGIRTPDVFQVQVGALSPVSLRTAAPPSSAP